MADALVADHVDERSLARAERALERAANVTRALDVLAVTTELREHPIVADVLEHVEGIGPALEQRHLLEARPPRAVVPENRLDRQAVAHRGLDVEAADAEPAVAGDEHDLFPRPRQLGADRHANAVADGSERPRVDDLPWEPRPEPLGHPARQREAVDHHGGIAIEHLTELAAQAIGMDRALVVRLPLGLGDRALVVLTHLPHLAQPLRLGELPPGEPLSLRGVDQLAQHELGVADHRELRGHVEPDAVRRGVDLNIARLVAPRRRLTELLAAPEAKADRQHDVGAAGEGLLPHAADRQ